MLHPGLLITCLLLTFSVAQDTNFSTFIPETNCEFHYTIIAAHFSFSNCVVSTQVFTSWLQCLSKCCRNLPGSGYDTASLQGISDCKTFNDEGEETSPLVAVFIAILALFFCIIVVCVLIMLVKAVRESNSHSFQIPEDVPVEWPDQQQNLTVTPRSIHWLRATPESRLTDPEGLCSICLDECCSAMLVCGHSYHPKCIQRWLRKSHFCPLCHRQYISQVKIFCNHCQEQYFLCRLGLISRANINEWICETCIEAKQQRQRGSLLPIFNTFNEDVSHVQLSAIE